MKYDAIIGLEIHAEIKTKSKMFCACDNDASDQAPNTAVCPICLGHPGTLPVPNKRALELVILAGLATHCHINRVSKFDRKNYFYPDLPKGYQISQYDLPLCYDGYLEIDGEKVLITRIHIEEDTGKSTHPKDGDHTLLDFNRAGTPLLEMVTEPVIKSAEEAKKFGQKFQQLLRYLNISSADMEKGEMRCEANVSVQAAGKWEYKDNKINGLAGYELNPKVEVKNINSFRSLEKAIKFEIERQSAALEKGEVIAVETRGWDDSKNVTKSQRVKETAADYRYFPEPDIPPLAISDDMIASIAEEIGELPEAKSARFVLQYGFKADLADVITYDQELANWTEEVISELGAWINAQGDSYERQDKNLAQTAGNLIAGELLYHLKTDHRKISDLHITPENFAELVCLIYQGKINSSAGQTILKEMYANGGDPEDIMKNLGLEQIDNEAELIEAIKIIIEKNPAQAAEYKAGKLPLIQFFVGKVMAETKGKANPEVVRGLLEKLLVE
ncbi:MAG: Asp-tRNA(Asn)/Glu-tRNA(Gln) amidotransferase subunit GatB [Candidatus Falkowbacteria bacterium]